MELNYEEIFKTSLQAMRINRSDPYIARDKKWLTHFILVHGAYTDSLSDPDSLLSSVFYVNLKENDFPATCKNGIISVVYVVITFQYSIMLWKQKHLRILMDTMKRDYTFAKSLPMEEQKVLHEFAMQGQHVCTQWFWISFIGFALFIVKNIFLYIYYWIVEGEINLIPLYELVYPDFVEDRKENIFVYIITYAWFTAYGTYSSIMYMAYVPLGPIFLLHGCGQLELVIRRIDKLFDSEDLEVVGEKLKDIVKQLQYIYNFVERIQLCFRVAYEFTLKTTTILLPITSFEVIESLKHGELSLEFMVFIIGGVLFSSSPCFYSDLLMEKGEGVRMAIYCCGWEKVYDRGIRTNIKIILQRALRPIAIRTLFRSLCLNTLADLFQQAYTIFNLMNAVFS